MPFRPFAAVGQRGYVVLGRLLVAAESLCSSRAEERIRRMDGLVCLISGKPSRFPRFGRLLMWGTAHTHEFRPESLLMDRTNRLQAAQLQSLVAVFMHGYGRLLRFDLHSLMLSTDELGVQDA
jgi:hypothetical protein